MYIIQHSIHLRTAAQREAEKEATVRRMESRDSRTGIFSYCRGLKGLFNA